MSNAVAFPIIVSSVDGSTMGLFINDNIPFSIKNHIDNPTNKPITNISKTNKTLMTSHILCFITDP